MTRQPIRLSGEVRVSYHQFFMLDEGFYPEDGGRLSWHSNGLATTASGLLGINAGIHTGPVELVVERHTDPPEPDLDAWEDVVEVSLDAPAGALRVSALMDDIPGQLRTPATAGRYRARVHATGRDSAVDESSLNILEHYLIQLWPDTGDRAAELLKGASRYGTQRRKACGMVLPGRSMPATINEAAPNWQDSTARTASWTTMRST
ncbi:hypothetical protein ACVDFE_22920 [Lentzea chajnantorensis]